MDDKNPLKMKVTELKVELGKRGLSQTGLKFDLAQRLQTAMDVDEFGSLPSLSSQPESASSPSSSSLSSSSLPIKPRDSTEDGDPPSHPSRRTPRSQFAEELPAEKAAEEHKQTLVQMGGDDAGDRQNSRPSEQRKSVSSTRAGSDVSEPETLVSDGGDRGGNGVKADKVNRLADISVLDVEETPKTISGRDIEDRTDGIVGAHEKSVDAELCQAVEASNGPSSGSLAETKKNAREEDCAINLVKDVSRPPLDSANPPDVQSSLFDSGQVGSPAAVRNRQAETVRTEPGEGRVSRDENGYSQAVIRVETERQELEQIQKQEHEQEQKQGHKHERAQHMVLENQQARAGCKAAETRSAESEKGALSPNSQLLCCSTSERRGGEDRVRLKNRAQSKRLQGVEVTDAETKANPVSTAAVQGEHEPGVKDCSDISIEDRERRGKAEKESSCESSIPTDVQRASKTVDIISKAKSIQVKEQTPAPSSTESVKNPSAKIGISAGESKKVGVPKCDEVTSKVMHDVAAARKARVRSHAASDQGAKMARRAERFRIAAGRPGVSLSQSATTKLSDPCGSFFPDSNDTSGVGCNPSLTARLRVASAPPLEGGNETSSASTKRKRAKHLDVASAALAAGRGADGDAMFLRSPSAKRSPSGTGITPDKVCKEKQRKSKRAKVRERTVRFSPASSDGATNDPAHKATANTLPVPPGRRMSLASTFVLLGVKPAPKLSTTTTSMTADAAGMTGDEGHSARSPRRGGGKRLTPSMSHPSDARQDERRASPKRRFHSGDLMKRAPPTHSPPGGVREDEGVSKSYSSRDGDRQALVKAAEQAAKMTARRTRFAQNPRAPSFR